MAMFDPVYVTKVLNDILGRRGLEVKLVPKAETDPADRTAQQRPQAPAKEQKAG